MNKDINYSFLCFIWIIGIISFLIFFSIGYVSYLENFRINENAKNQFMAIIWMGWNYFIPFLGAIMSIFLPIRISIAEITYEADANCVEDEQ